MSAQGAVDGTEMWSPDPSFDRYARLVRGLLGVPTALASLVDDERQLMLGADGLEEPLQTDRVVPVSQSLCHHVVLGADKLVIDDLDADQYFSTHPARVDFGVVAYAGWPLVDLHGSIIGALCAIDTERREWTETQLENLADLAAACSTEIVQHQLTERLTTTVSELQRSNTQLAAFAGQVSHDLRNPLGSVAGNLELIDDLASAPDPDLDTIRTIAGRAHASAVRMGGLVDNMLRLAAIRGSLSPEKVDVARLVADVLVDLESELGGAVVRTTDLETVEADPVQLRTLLQNLVSNAAKHGALDGPARIDVAAVRGPGYWRLTVADHGKGIAERDRDRVFEAFVRIDLGVAGSGVGLATCQRIAEEHGGRIGVDETPGGGATFWLDLPTT